jgi:hypothetical protein
MRNVKRSVVAGVVLLVVAGAVWVVGAAAADPNVTAVQRVVRETMQLEHRVGIPDGPPDAVVSAADGARMNAATEIAVKAHFAGTLLATRLEQFKAIIDSQVGGKPTNLDGGVNNIIMGETTVGTDTATVHLRATTWVKGSQGGKISAPTSRDNWTFELVKVDGKWLVSTETTDFRG